MTNLLDPPEGYVSRRLGVLQTRLQHGRAWRIGNAISTARWYVWRLRGGRYESDLPAPKPERKDDDG